MTSVLAHASTTIAAVGQARRMWSVGVAALLIALATTATTAGNVTVAEPYGVLRILQPQRIEVVRVRELSSMPFEKAELTPDQARELDEFIKQELWPMIVYAVIVTGYSDRLEASAAADLAERRAAAVKDYLIAKGLEPSYIYWEGRASSEPISATCSDTHDRAQLIQCLAAHRRVTIEAVGKIPKPPERRQPKTGA